MAETSVVLMQMPRDFLVSLLLMIGMKTSAIFDTAMSAKRDRRLLLEVMASGDVTYVGSKNSHDYIRGNCLVWVGRRCLSLQSLSCCPVFLDNRDDIDMTSELVVKVVRNSRKLKALYLYDWGRLTKLFVEAHVVEIFRLCDDVETLVLSISTLNDACVIGAVRGMHKLIFLSLRCGLLSRLSNDFLIALSSNCPNLIEADIGSGKIEDDGLVRFVRGCSYIQKLNIANSRQITDAGMKAIAYGCRFIKSLNVRACMLITDDSLKAVAENCDMLEKIDISCCKEVTDVAFIHLGNNCSALIDVDMSGCSKLTDHAVVHLVKMRGLNLRYLKMNRLRCPSYTDCSVKAISQYCPHLMIFDCSINSEITDVSISQLAQACEKLIDVNLSGCKKITDASVHKFGDFCAKLEILSVYECYFITQSCKDDLKMKIKNLSIHAEEEKNVWYI